MKNQHRYLIIRKLNTRTSRDIRNTTTLTTVVLALNYRPRRTPRNTDNGRTWATCAENRCGPLRSQEKRRFVKYPVLILPVHYQCRRSLSPKLLSDEFPKSDRNYRNITTHYSNNLIKMHQSTSCLR